MEHNDRRKRQRVRIAVNQIKALDVLARYLPLALKSHDNGLRGNVER